MWQVVAPFLRDWLPSVAVLIGAAWVFYRWLHAERLRQQKERSSLDGQLKHEAVRLSEQKTFVLFSATWLNRSPLSFPVDTDKTGLDIFEIDDSIAIGATDIRVNPEVFGAALIQLRPYKNLQSLVIEPQSQSELQLTSVLENGKLYMARYRLYRKTPKGSFARTRICLCNLRT